jgi:hypothetical protein
MQDRDMLQGRQKKELHEALLDAFTYATFERMLSYELDKMLENIAPRGSFEDVVFQVINAAQREGWLVDLIQGAHEANPGNQKLHAFAKKQGLAFDAPPPEKLRQMLMSFAEEFDLPEDMSQTEQFERMLLAFSRELGLAPDMMRWQKSSALQPSGTLFHTSALAKDLAFLQEQVCRVEAGMAMGTGFQVGPNAIMTAYHVVKDVLEAKVPAPEVVIRFGYLQNESGVLQEGRTYHLAATNWLIDTSPYSQHDMGGVRVDSETIPEAAELNYALLRVEGLVEDEPGWIEIRDKDIEYRPGSSLYILQHLRGGPLQLAFQPNSVIGINRNRTRLFHRTWTEPGSSGAPCFDHEWNLIGFHMSREPGNIRTYNVGVPITAVVKLLKTRGLYPLPS